MPPHTPVMFVILVTAAASPPPLPIGAAIERAASVQAVLTAAARIAPVEHVKQT